MRCEFEFCIYNYDGGCSAGGIQIDALGMCDACLTVTLDPALLAREKQRQFEELQHRWQEE